MAKPAKTTANEPGEDHILERLYATVKRRRRAKPEASHTASLFAKGRPQIAKKMGEEAVEVVVAAMTRSMGGSRS